MQPSVLAPAWLSAAPVLDTGQAVQAEEQVGGGSAWGQPQAQQQCCTISCHPHPPCLNYVVPNASGINPPYCVECYAREAAGGAAPAAASTALVPAGSGGSTSSDAPRGAQCTTGMGAPRRGAPKNSPNPYRCPNLVEPDSDGVNPPYCPRCQFREDKRTRETREADRARVRYPPHGDVPHWALEEEQDRARSISAAEDARAVALGLPPGVPDGVVLSTRGEVRSSSEPSWARGGEGSIMHGRGMSAALAELGSGGSRGVSFSFGSTSTTRPAFIASDLSFGGGARESLGFGASSSAAWEGGTVALVPAPAQAPGGLGERSPGSLASMLRTPTHTVRDEAAAAAAASRHRDRQGKEDGTIPMGSDSEVSKGGGKRGLESGGEGFMSSDGGFRTADGKTDDEADDGLGRLPRDPHMSPGEREALQRQQQQQREGRLEADEMEGIEQADDMLALKAADASTVSPHKKRADGGEMAADGADTQKDGGNLLGRDQSGLLTF